VYHFREEEGLMESHGIDERHQRLHRSEHEAFLLHVSARIRAFDPDDREAGERLFDFLVSWLVYHILGSDQNMARQARAIEAGTTAREAYRREEQKKDKSVDTLLDAMHGLFEQVMSRNRELEELNRTLEARIEERTRNLREANILLESLSLTDELTRLPNRRHGMAKLEALLGESTEPGPRVSCLMIDADHFKEINDSHGHDAGDAVLVALGKELKAAVRTDDIVCRLGGDEFMVILPATGHAGAMEVGRKVLTAVNRMRVTAGDGSWRGSISVGVAAALQGETGTESLLKRADEALYAAKKAGRNRVCGSAPAD
jgi:diguanylate cyclase (GGDEF)-like protein